MQNTEHVTFETLSHDVLLHIGKGEMMSKEKGKLIVVSGFSGVGKGTVIGKVMEARPEYGFSVSCTTRDPREGEIHGVHYFFITKDEFLAGIRDGRFLEHAQYSDNYYGTPREYVESLRDEGINVVLDIEYQGAFQVKQACPEAILIFLIPPSAETLVKRLVNRGTEDHEKIGKRLARAVEEADQAPGYDCILVNDKLEDAVADFLAVVDEPALGVDHYEKNLAIVPEIKKDLQAILEKDAF